MPKFHTILYPVIMRGWDAEGRLLEYRIDLFGCAEEFLFKLLRNNGRRGGGIGACRGAIAMRTIALLVRMKQNILTARAIAGEQKR
jgi:hypothetical protein